MAGRFLLDTNVVIALLAEEPALRGFLREADEVFISSVSFGELYFGAHKSQRVEQNLARLERLAREITVLDCNTITARVYGELKNQLRLRGLMIPDNDIWIAATARQHDLTLATRDAHFERITGLQIVSW